MKLNRRPLELVNEGKQKRGRLNTKDANPMCQRPRQLCANRTCLVPHSWLNLSIELSSVYHYFETFCTITLGQDCLIV